MNLTYLDLAVIITYFAVLAIFALFVRRTSGFDDFSLAHRSVPAAMVFASLCGAYLGPGYSLGVAGKAYASGFLMNLAWIFFSLQTVLVGIWLAPRLRRYSGVYTLGGVMQAAYGGMAQPLTGIVSIGLCIGFASVLGRAGGVVLAGALHLRLGTAIAAITGIGVLYALTGGLKSVIATEGFQFAIVLSSFSILVLRAAHRIPSWTEANATASQLTLNGWNATTCPQLGGMALLFLLGETLIPPYANRALASKSEKSSSQGFIFAGIFSLFWFIMISAAGVMARILLGPHIDPDSALIQLARTVLPSGLLGLFLVALAAIVMSTQESLLNAASVCLTRDLLPTSMPDRLQLRFARGATLAFGAVAAWLALRSPSIIDGLLICYSIWAPTILPALIWALLGLPARRWAGVGSIVGGAIVSTAGFTLTSHSASINVLYGILGSFMGAVIGYLATPRRRYS